MTKRQSAKKLSSARKLALILIRHLHPHPIADGQWGIDEVGEQMLGRLMVVAS